MTSLLHRSSRIPSIAAFCLLAGFLVLLSARGYAETTPLLVASSLLMFGCCWASAIHLLGSRAALALVLIAMSAGWLAEQLGATLGWFFGDYHYTDVLGPRLLAVPVVIPMMWFALSYCGYVIANLIVWQAPDAPEGSRGMAVLMAVVGAMVVTCYDLGVDPYMVHVLKAWIMTRTDGWWFGETIEGFAGWMIVAFAIGLPFRLLLRKRPAAPSHPATTRHVLVPLSVYAGLMVFQVCLGYPHEARTIALFAMGFPLLTAACGLLRWRAARRQDVPAADGAGTAAMPVALKEAA
ncbi:carotenoid biosynthesis protein [Massilia sp. TN1-12]|uniref:carotenoid biosynthesis protein n=1 Tax=Massilia paldalensis TaxID=3377675 RepID=UPI00384B0CE6